MKIFFDLCIFKHLFYFIANIRQMKQNGSFIFYLKYTFVNGKILVKQTVTICKVLYVRGNLCE